MTQKDTSDHLEWNPLDFKCPNRCDYCPEWRKDFSTIPVLRGDPPWDEIPDSTAIWVGCDTDLFHDAVPSNLISQVLARAKEEAHGYIFCTKNPKRYKEFIDEVPHWSYLSTTIESDIDYKNCNAESPLKRLEHVKELKQLLDMKFSESWLHSTPEICICIQPVLTFTPRFLEWFKEVKPDQISIGPEKKGYNTPEPPLQDILEFAVALNKHADRVNVHGRTVYSTKPKDIITLEEWTKDRTIKEVKSWSRECLTKYGH